jgi:hypothetical protein
MRLSKVSMKVGKALGGKGFGKMEAGRFKEKYFWHNGDMKTEKLDLWYRAVSLVNERRAEVHALMESYADISMATGPCNRKKAEEAVAEAYTALNMPVPPFEWYESPVKGWEAAGDGQIPLARIMMESAASSDPTLDFGLKHAVAAQYDRLERAFTDHDTRIAREMRPMTRSVEGLRDLLPMFRQAGRVTPCRLGSADGWDLALIHACWMLGVPPGPTFEALRKTVHECGWWWPFQNVCVMCERPRTLKIQDYRLHCDDGPAVDYVDGYELYFLRDVPVTRRVALGLFNAKEIDEQDNAELRRVMIDRFGLDKYLLATKAQQVHQDKYGILYKKELPDDETLVVVRVKNSTPEPDGTFKDYFLRVPPQMQRAREAIAWTFGLEEEEYRPMKET